MTSTLTLFKQAIRPVGLSLGVAAAATLGGALMVGPAVADDHAGYYVGIGIGYNSPEDSDIQGNGFELGAEMDSDLPSVGFFTVGYDYEGPLRGEFELGRRSNGVDEVSGVPGSGDVDVTSFMFNALYDFENAFGMVTPYLGGGLGVASISLDDGSPINGSVVDGSDNVLAAQFIAGASARIAKDLDLTGQYNFLITRDGDYTTTNGQDFDAEYQTHSVTLGLRFNFPTPSPAPEPKPEPVVEKKPEPKPAPQPEPEIVRNFIVFFDWDSAAVTPEAMDILRQAVDYAKTGKVSRIVLTGHADTSGAASYNQGLSQRRAEAVRGEVVGLGYQGTIDTEARGEAEPLLATGDSVREPQNRRVEITLK